MVDRTALYRARDLIPRDASFRIVTGPNLTGATDLTLRSIASYATYFLMPRRPSESARWILCYGCDLDRLGAPVQVLWRDEKGIAVGRLRS